MTEPLNDFDAIKLAAQVTKALNVIHRVTYALISSELRVLYASPNFSTVLSQPTINILGSPIDELIWELVGAESNLKAVLDGTQPFFIFERINREMADGRLIYLNLNITLIDDPEMDTGLLITIEDITEQAQMEQHLTQHRNELLLVKKQLSEANAELQHLNKFKSLFLSMAAHDLRTPLTFIHSYSELIMHLIPSDSPPQIEEFAEIIHRQSIRMDWLINDFLDLDSIEQGKLALKPEEKELNKIVDQAVSLLTNLAEKRKQNLSLHVWPDNIVFTFDDNRLQQILFNLINNAIKYTPQEGKIVVSTRVEEETAVIQVTDSGQGMNEKQQAAAFNLYYRTEDADDYDTTGRGLGLYIVRMLTEAHGGHVDLSSKPDQGSTFRVYLPMN